MVQLRLSIVSLILSSLERGSLRRAREQVTGSSLSILSLKDKQDRILAGQALIYCFPAADCGHVLAKSIFTSSDLTQGQQRWQTVSLFGRQNTPGSALAMLPASFPTILYPFCINPSLLFQIISFCR